MDLVLVLLAWGGFLVGVVALFLVAAAAPGRLLPLLAGLALGGLAYGITVWPLWLGLGLDCGSLVEPRFVDIDAVPRPHRDLAARCLNSEEVYAASVWLEVVLAGAGAVIVAFVRAVGGCVTIALLVAAALAAMGSVAIPDRGLSPYLIAVGLLIVAGLAALAVVGALGSRSGVLAVAAGLIVVGAGLYLAGLAAGAVAVVVLVTIVITLGAAGADAFLSDGDGP